MRVITFVFAILFIITTLSSNTFASRDDHDYDAVNGGDAGRQYWQERRPRGPCLRWFLFFCISRGNVGDTPSYSPPANQPLEPAMTPHLGSKGAPVMGPFNARMASCAAGCSFTNWGVWGDTRHQIRKSCHNSGSAIDVHAIRCSDGTHKPGSSRFREFVSCMDGSSQLSVIFGHGEHKNHVHIALTSCQVHGIGNIRTR